MARMETLFKAVADTTRQRLLQVLCGHELSVSELVEVLRLPQSSVSRHLKALREAGLLVDRRLGTTTLCAARPTVPDTAEHPGSVTGRGNGHRVAEFREHLLDWAAHEPLDARLADRLAQVLRRREAEGGFFDRIGTRWDQLRIDAFGEDFHLEALTTLLPREWTVADIGTGTGYLLPALSARFQRVIAIDPAPAMLALARSRPELREAANVTFREGALEHLPVETGELDLAIASLVLHHVVTPAGVLPEVRRAVKTGGRLLIIEQREHGGDEFHERMGDQWRGFEPQQLQEWVRAAGFADIQVARLTQAQPTGRQLNETPALYALVASAA